MQNIENFSGRENSESGLKISSDEATLPVVQEWKALHSRPHIIPVQIVESNPHEDVFSRLKCLSIKTAEKKPEV